jgi:hypothetical protein
LPGRLDILKLQAKASPNFFFLFRRNAAEEKEKTEF